MFLSSFTRSIFLFIFFSGVVTNCSDLEEAVKNLRQLVNTKSSRVTRDSEDISTIWLDYEFNSGAGNREELVVKDISIHEYSNLPETVSHWQFLEINGTGFLIHTEKSILSFHKLDLDNVSTGDPVTLNVTGVILTYKVIGLNNFQSGDTLEVDVVAVLCVKSGSVTSLQWYRLLDGESFQFFWLWPVQKHIKDLEFIQYGDRKELLLLEEDEILFGAQYSPVSVYSFSIDFSNNFFHFWLTQRSLAPKVNEMQICPIYETMSFALQGDSDVFLYEYKDITVDTIFQPLQTIKSQDLRNLVCFESGYLQFLAISGPEAGLFHFFEGEFHYNVESEASFDVSEISWIKDIRLDTYRDESLLLIQLKNSTVIALAWQGLSFKRIQLPSNVLDHFDLSKITVIPKFGFILGNKFVKFHTELKDLKHPSQHTTERLLILQRLLNSPLHHQEEIFNKTESFLEKSYFKNPVVTGFWNVSEVNAENATITDNVTYHYITVGSMNLTIEDLSVNATDYTEKLKNLERKLHRIDSNLENALDSNLTELNLNSELEIFGNIHVLGNLTVENLTAEFINNIDVSKNDFPSRNENVIRELNKLSSIIADNLTIYSLNGIPLSDIRFSNSFKDYSGIDFSKVTQAVVGGDLFFEKINGVDWDSLMKNVVWKNKKTFIPGNTVVEGTLIADNVEIETLNELEYPDDYVLINDDMPTNVTGRKSFNQLLVQDLHGLKTINGIDIDDFVILHKDNVLNEEITFENLEVEGPTQIDGEVVGAEREEVKLINETSEITSHIIFSNLTVVGNIIFENLFHTKNPLHFDDLLLKTDENVKITGTKTFLGNVGMRGNVTITSGLINGHPIEDFATTNTYQEFPNLTKILSNVRFENVTYGSIKKLEDLLKETGNSENCQEKMIVLKPPIVVDELSFNSINDNMSYDEFSNSVNETFQNIILENITTETLMSNEIAPKVINGVNFTDFIKNLESLNNITDYSIDDLETDNLDVKFINEMSLDEINDLIGSMNMLLEDISNRNASLESLRVTGKIKVNLINGIVLKDLYKENHTVIFKDDVNIGKLTILGYLNGFNFTENVLDTVLKTDTDIVIHGHKTFETVNCNEFEVATLNDHPLENIFDPTKDQVLSGSVIANGTVTVLKNFHATGSIDNIKFQDLMDRFKFLGNNSYEFHGNVRFQENVSVENLIANGTIQGIDFDSFLKTTISKNEDNVTISGTKVFENSVTFNNKFTVHEKLNDINLKNFWENVVFIDKPFSIKSKIFFKDGIKVERDLIVEKDLEAQSIMGIDISELKLGILYSDRPNYIKESIELTNVTFNEDIELNNINGLNMRLLISLKNEQTIPVEVLKCRNVTVDNYQVLGKINDESLDTVQETTFMKTGNQNITGHINFKGHVHTRRDFNARFINGIDPTRVIPLNSKSTLEGNFKFEKPVILNQSLRVLGSLNGIDPNRWEATAVKASNFMPQIITGNWTINGSVYFENRVTGSNVLNGTRIDQLADTLGKRHLEMDALISETYESLDSICLDLKHLKHYSEKQIYRFSSFDYLQVIEFDNRIVSLHHFELEGLDYLMISYSTCHMHTYLFTGKKFELVANVPNFGIIDRWTTFRHNGSVYFLTSGTQDCGKNYTNLWKLEHEEFTHVSSLGHKIGSRKVDEQVLLMMIDRKDEKRSSKTANEDLEKVMLSLAGDDDVKTILQDDHLLLNSKQRSYEYDVGKTRNTIVERRSGNPEIFHFKAGVFEKEMFLYYDEDVSEDRIFIYNNNEPRKILQTIKAYKPTSFAVLNFEGNVETLLLFVENKKYLRMYEYRGVKGFTYRDNIIIDIDKLLSFKIRKYDNLAKRQHLALIHENRLTILEANMYGEKTDMDWLTC
nr:uncharacterized protein LOC116429477 [Nomia melanderi]